MPAQSIPQWEAGGVAGRRRGLGGLSPKPSKAPQALQPLGEAARRVLKCHRTTQPLGLKQKSSTSLYLKGTASAPAVMMGARGLGLGEMGNIRMTARAEMLRVQGLHSLQRAERFSTVSYGGAGWEPLPREWTQDRGCHLLVPGIHGLYSQRPTKDPKSSRA